MSDNKDSDKDDDTDIYEFLVDLPENPFGINQSLNFEASPALIRSGESYVSVEKKVNVRTLETTN